MLKCREAFEKFLAACSSSKTAGFPQVFFQSFKKCLLCWILWIQNYQMTGKYLTSNTTFSKKVNPMKYQIQTYILVRTWNLLFIILLVYPIRPWNLLNVKKKKSNLIIAISSYNICSEIKSQQAKKPFVIQYQKRLIFFWIPLFHFIKSFSTIQFNVCF